MLVARGRDRRTTSLSTVWAPGRKLSHKTKLRNKLFKNRPISGNEAWPWYTPNCSQIPNFKAWAWFRGRGT